MDYFSFYAFILVLHKYICYDNPAPIQRRLYIMTIRENLRAVLHYES